MPCEWLVPYHKIHCCKLDMCAELRHVLSIGKGRATIVSAQHTTTNRQLTIFQAQAQDQDQFCQPWCVLVYTRGIPCKWLVSQTDVNSLEVYIKQTCTVIRQRQSKACATTTDRQLTIFQAQADQDQFCLSCCALVWTRGMACEWLVPYHSNTHVV